MKYGYVIVFNDDNGKPVVKNKIYNTLNDASIYADTIDQSRCVKIYPAINHQPKGDGEFTCLDIETMADLIEDMKMLLMFDYNEDGTAPKASHHICMSLNHLSNAYQEMKLANIEQMQG